MEHYETPELELIEVESEICTFNIGGDESTIQISDTVVSGGNGGW